MKKAPSFVALCILTLSACMPRQFNEGEHGSHTSASGGPIHGMILFGKNKIYASHIPMINNSSHHWQAIFEITLNNADKATYFAKQKKHARGFVTIQPTEGFPLPSLIKGSKDAFGAKVYFGNFEAGTDDNGQPVHINYKSTVTDQLLPFNSGNKNLMYFFLADEGQNGFLVHRISDEDGSKKGNFDQILKVNVDKSVDGMQGLQKVEVQRPNQVSRRLKTSDNPISSPFGTITILEEISCLTGPGFGPADTCN